MTHDPLCGWHTKTGCFDEQEDCFECVIITRTRADERSNNFTPDEVSDFVTKVIEEVECECHRAERSRSLMSKQQGNVLPMDG